jgi:hypothetical protein
MNKNELGLLGVNAITDRSIYLAAVDNLNEIPEKLNLNGKFFGCLLAIDASNYSKEIISELMEKLLRNGMVFLVCWGTNCEWVHDLADDEINKIQNDPSDKNVIMTTWLKEDKLSDAIWNLFNVAFPADDYWDNCKSELIISGNSKKWITEIKKEIRNQIKHRNL